MENFIQRKRYDLMILKWIPACLGSGIPQNFLKKGWQPKLDTTRSSFHPLLQTLRMPQWLELRQLPFRTWGFLDLRKGISVDMAHMDMPLKGADVKQCWLFINAKHLERVKNKKLRHEISEVLMSLYGFVLLFGPLPSPNCDYSMFWMTFWLEGLPWD